MRPRGRSRTFAAEPASSIRRKRRSGRSGGPARRREHCRAVPPRRHRRELVLQLVECLTSAPLGHFEGFSDNGGFLAHRSPQGAKMRQKSGKRETSAEKVDQGHPPRDPQAVFGARRRSASCWRACAGKRASPRCAGARASPRASTTTGRRSSWKPARSGWPVTRHAPPPPDEVKELRRETRDLKEVVAEQALELRLLKKSMIADGGDDE